MPFLMIRDDITRVHADAIVNPANTQLRQGSGTSRGIYLAAGEQELEKACQQIGSCALGKAVLTEGFRLPAKYIIHAVGPVWRGGWCRENKTLYRTYQSALELAQSHGCESIAFPLLSAGNYKFPKDKAMEIAVSAIRDFLEDHDMVVYMVLYDHDSVSVGRELSLAVKEYIDDHYVETQDENYLADVPWRGKNAGDVTVYLTDTPRQPRSYRVSAKRPTEYLTEHPAERPTERPTEHPSDHLSDHSVSAVFPTANLAGTVPGGYSSAESAPRPAPGGGDSAEPMPGSIHRGPDSARAVPGSAPGGIDSAEPVPRSASRVPISAKLVSESVSRAAFFAAAPYGSDSDLDDRINHLEETFSQMLLRLIDERGLKDSVVYKRANIDRRHFSKIRGDMDYAPSRKTVFAFIIALELGQEEARELMNKAGYSFSRSSRFDVIVSYFLENGIYDIFQINEVLFSYGQPVIGG